MNSSFYPIMINLKDKRLLIIGAGKVALRKARKLMDCKADLTVLAPQVDEEFYKYKDNIKIIKDKYKKKYILNFFLVIAASDDKILNESIESDCKYESILCNNISNSATDVMVPSSIKRGDLTISVSTNGKSPSLSRKIKNDLSEKYDEGYIEYLNLLGDIRELVLEKCEDENKRKEILNEIIDLSLDDLKERKKLYEDKSRL